MIGWLLGGLGAIVATRLATKGLRGTNPPATFWQYAPEKQTVDLPFNLLRSQVPVDAPVRAQAIEQYLEGQQVRTRFPQKMIMQQWKQDGGVFAANVEGALSAFDYRKPEIENIYFSAAGRVPTMPAEQVAQRLNYLPNTGSPLQDPVARGLSQNPMLNAYQLGLYAIEARDVTGTVDIPVQIPAPPVEDGQNYEAVWANGRLQWLPKHY